MPNRKRTGRQRRTQRLQATRVRTGEVAAIT